MQRAPQRRSPAGVVSPKRACDIFTPRAIGGRHLVDDGRAERQRHLDHGGEAEIVGHELQMLRPNADGDRRRPVIGFGCRPRDDVGPGVQPYFRSRSHRPTPACPGMRLVEPTKVLTNSVADGRRRPAGDPNCSSRPWLSTATRSAMDSASSWSWVTMSVVMPETRCSRFTSICMSSRRFLSSAAKGSSSSRIDGSIASARASATRCCWPPESWRGRRSPIAGSWTRSSRRRASGRRVRRVDAARGKAVGDVLGDSSGAGTARSSGTRCRRRAGWAAACRRSRRRR